MSETKIARIILTKDGSFTDRNELVQQMLYLIRKGFLYSPSREIEVKFKFKEVQRENTLYHL